MIGWGAAFSSHLPYSPPHSRHTLKVEIPQDHSSFGKTIKETPQETVACEKSSLVKEVPRPQSKPVAHEKPNHPPKSLPTSQTPSSMIHAPKIQFLDTTPHISQIGCPQIWERHLECTELWIQHSIWRTLGVTPRFGGHPSEQLKWMNRAWRTPNQG